MQFPSVKEGRRYVMTGGRNEGEGMKRENETKGRMEARTRIRKTYGDVGVTSPRVLNRGNIGERSASCTEHVAAKESEP